MLVAGDGDNYFAGAAIVAEFAEVNALPGAEIQAPVGDGDSDRGADKSGFGVGRHIVIAFAGVAIKGFALLHKSVENSCEVNLHVGVGILVDGKCGGCMFDEDVHQPNFRPLRQLSNDLRGDKVATSPSGRQRYFNLLPHI